MFNLLNGEFCLNLSHEVISLCISVDVLIKLTTFLTTTEEFLVDLFIFTGI